MPVSSQAKLIQARPRQAKPSRAEPSRAEPSIPATQQHSRQAGKQASKQATNQPTIHKKKQHKNENRTTTTNSNTTAILFRHSQLRLSPQGVTGPHGTSCPLRKRAVSSTIRRRGRGTATYTSLVRSAWWMWSDRAAGPAVVCGSHGDPSGMHLGGHCVDVLALPVVVATVADQVDALVPQRRRSSMFPLLTLWSLLLLRTCPQRAHNAGLRGLGIARLCRSMSLCESSWHLRSWHPGTKCWKLSLW